MLLTTLRATAVAMDGTTITSAAMTTKMMRSAITGGEAERPDSHHYHLKIGVRPVDRRVGDW